MAKLLSRILGSQRLGSQRLGSQRLGSQRLGSQRLGPQLLGPQRRTLAPGLTEVKTRAHRKGRHLEYSPNIDGDADPGEIVWTWVPYEEDPRQGKDRPVLVVGRDERTVLGLMLSSQSERNGRRNWLALGPGEWDRDKRPSWLRLDRVLEIDHDGIRREGAILDLPRFTRVADILRRNYGWS